jgi:hypothetical protein
MSDPTQLGPAPAPICKKPFIASLAEAVARHAYLALAVIAVLAALAVGLYVYYHGFLFLGPYAQLARLGARRKADDGDGDKEDPETERLIEALNRPAR